MHPETMMENPNRENLIGRYLSGKLPENELISFEEKLQADPQLAEEVALQGRLVGLLKETGLRSFLGRVEQTFSRTSNLSPGLRFPEPPGSSVAAKVARPKALQVYIAFEGESFFDQPILKIRFQKPRIKVKIYPPTEKYFYHYRISRTLTLYGDFETDHLTFISEVYEGHQYYALRIGHLEYELGHYPVIRPLLEMQGLPARFL